MERQLTAIRGLKTYSLKLIAMMMMIMIIYKLGNKAFRSWDRLLVPLIIPKQTVMNEAEFMRFAGSVCYGNLKREGCLVKFFTAPASITIRSKIHDGNPWKLKELESWTLGWHKQILQKGHSQSIRYKC
jgi:hypothetical protein